MRVVGLLCLVAAIICLAVLLAKLYQIIYVLITDQVKAYFRFKSGKCQSRYSQKIFSEFFYQNSQDLRPGQLKVDAPSEIVADEDSQADSGAVSIIVMKLGWN